MSQTYYRLAGPHILSEELEGEVIAINMESGAYYSLGGSASLIWTRIGSGASVSEVVELYQPTDDTDIKAEVESFLSTLLDKQLIAVSESGSTDPVKDDHEKGSLVFKSPNIDEFTDMEEFLLVDPIHDVASTGWPNLPEEDKSDS